MVVTLDAPGTTPGAGEDEPPQGGDQAATPDPRTPSLVDSRGDPPGTIGDAAHAEAPSITTMFYVIACDSGITPELFLGSTALRLSCHSKSDGSNLRDLSG